MARKKIREYDGKRLLKANIARLAGLDLPIKVVQVTATTNAADLLSSSPWLASTKLVVKPDMLFGQRGKHDLVGLNLDFPQVGAGGGGGGRGTSCGSGWVVEK